MPSSSRFAPALALSALLLAAGLAALALLAYRHHTEGMIAMAVQADLDRLELLAGLPEVRSAAMAGAAAPAALREALAAARPSRAAAGEEPGRHQAAALLGPAMVPLASSGSLSDAELTLQLAAALIQPAQGAFRSLRREGRHVAVRLLGPQAAPEAYLLTVSRLPVDQLAVMKARLTQGSGVIAVLGLLMAASVAALGSRGQASPLRLLAMQADGLAQGRRETCDVPACNPEVQTLARALNALAAELAVRDSREGKAREDALQAREELDRIFHAAGDGLWVLAPDSTILRVNRRLSELAGLPVDELVGRKCHEVFPEERCHTDECPMRLARRGQECGSREAERPSPDGRRLVCAVTSTPIAGSDGEFRGLLQNVRDVTDRHEAEERLSRTFEQLQVVVRDMPVMMAALDSSLRPLAWNRECERVTGYAAAEMVGNPESLTLLLPDPAQREDLGRILPGMRGDFRDMELSMTCRGGERRTVAWSSVSKEFPVPGWAHWGVGVDLTERIQARERLEAALREKETLIKEVHHRVKNNLQIITSLLYLQASKEGDPRVRGLLKECQHRVMSMAMVHEKLYRAADLGRIDICEYLASMAEHLRATYGRADLRVECCSPLKLSIERAVPLGLILNELLTNALKYAATGDESPVTVRVLAAPDGRVRLSVADAGPGLPEGFDPQQAETLGFQLVNALTQQLGGRLELLSDHGSGPDGEGLTVRIDFSATA